MNENANSDGSDKKSYVKPTLIKYGTVEQSTKTIGEPLPGVDALPGVELYGDPS